MIEQDRQRFDAVVEDEIDRLPTIARQWLDRIPVVVLDHPTNAMLDHLGVEPHQWTTKRRAFCGLHTGVSLPRRSVEVPEAHAFDQIHLFREGITRLAGAWDWVSDEMGDGRGSEEDRLRALERLRREIRITLLHEIGHHFGLGEEELGRLGFA